MFFTQKLERSHLGRKGKNNPTWEESESKKNRFFRQKLIMLEAKNDNPGKGESRGISFQGHRKQIEIKAPSKNNGPAKPKTTVDSFRK